MKRQAFWEVRWPGGRPGLAATAQVFEAPAIQGETEGCVSSRKDDLPLLPASSSCMEFRTSSFPAPPSAAVPEPILCWQRVLVPKPLCLEQLLAVLFRHNPRSALVLTALGLEQLLAALFLNDRSLVLEAALSRCHQLLCNN